MTQYLKEYNLEINYLKTSDCHQVFRFGPSKQYVSTKMVELPIMVKGMDGKDDVLKVYTYLVEADVPFLCGKRTLEKWNSKLDMKNKVLETTIEGERKDFRMLNTGSNHFALVIRSMVESEKEILYLNEGSEELTEFKAIRKVHEVNNHKSSEQLVVAYSNAGLMSPGVVNDCRVCHKFGK